MKHQWKTDERGDIKPFDEDADHPVAECIACGDSSGCLDGQEPGTSCSVIGENPRLDADNCPGVDQTVSVSVYINHPGQAVTYRDRRCIQKRVVFDLAALVDTQLDAVSAGFDDVVTEVVTAWRAERAQYFADWERATGLCPSTGPADTEEGAR